MNILIPILSKKENNENFLNIASSGAKIIILLFSVDPNSSLANATSEIDNARNLMEKIKKFIGQKKKSCEYVIDWNEAFTSIDHTAKLKKCTKIFLLSDETNFFSALVKKLKKQKAYKIEII